MHITLKQWTGSICVGTSLGLLFFLFFVFALEKDFLKSSYHAYVTSSNSTENVSPGSIVFTQASALVTNSNTEAPSEDDQKIVVIIPKMGYLVNFAKTPKGFIALIVIPIIIITYKQLVAIGLEIWKMINHKTSFKSHKKARITIVNYSKSIGLLFIICGIILLITAIFSIYDFSPNNTLGVSTSVPTPTSSPALFSSPSPSAETPSPTPDLPASVVISEIYYDPDLDHMKGDSPNENDFEWVELYNAGEGSANLKNWQIKDNQSSQTIAKKDLILNPGGYLVIAKVEEVKTIWEIAEDKFIAIGVNIGNGLSDSEDILQIKDSSNNLIDQVSYGSDDSLLPNLETIAQGHSFSRNLDTSDTDSTTDFVDMANPNPGI